MGAVAESPLACKPAEFKHREEWVGPRWARVWTKLVCACGHVTGEHRSFEQVMRDYRTHA